MNYFNRFIQNAQYDI